MNVRYLRIAGGFFIALLLLPVSVFFGISFLKSLVLSIIIGALFIALSTLMMKSFMKKKP